MQVLKSRPEEEHVTNARTKYLLFSFVTVRIGVWNFVWLGPGEFGMEGDFTGSGSLPEIGKCLRLNHELPAPFRVKDPEYVASNERDRFPVTGKRKTPL